MLNSYKMSKQLPVYDINYPGGGPQRPVTISDSSPVYSTYSGNLIGYGPLTTGVKCDAPIGHPNYGKDYHVVEYNPANNTYMAHFAGAPSSSKR